MTRPPSRLTYSEARLRLRDHAVVRAETPVEHSLSLPLPTLRFGQPAFASFSGPLVLQADGTAIQFPPETYCAISDAGRLLLFARVHVLPFSPDALSFSPVPLPPSAMTIDAFEDALRMVEALLDLASDRFFAGRQADDGHVMRRALEELLPAPLLPFYRTLLPDFWAWLSSKTVDVHEADR